MGSLVSFCYNVQQEVSIPRSRRVGPAVPRVSVDNIGLPVIRNRQCCYHEQNQIFNPTMCARKLFHKAETKEVVGAPAME